MRTDASVYFIPSFHHSIIHSILAFCLLFVVELSLCFDGWFLFNAFEPELARAHENGTHTHILMHQTWVFGKGVFFLYEHAYALIFRWFLFSSSLNSFLFLLLFALHWFGMKWIITNNTITHFNILVFCFYFIFARIRMLVFSLLSHYYHILGCSWTLFSNLIIMLMLMLMLCTLLLT